MSNKKVQQEWKRHWKEHSSLEDSGSILGNFLRQQRFKIVRSLLKSLPKNFTVLDMGCGGGTSLQNLKQTGFTNLTGIDFTQESVTRCQQQGFIPNKNVYLMDAKQTSFPSSSFDIVFSEGLWEHFLDPRPYMAEACRLSKNYIIVIQPNHFSLFGRLMNIGWTLLGSEKGGVPEYPFTMSYFTTFLSYYNFKLIKTKSTPLNEQKILLYKKQSEQT